MRGQQVPGRDLGKATLTILCPPLNHADTVLKTPIASAHAFGASKQRGNATVIAGSLAVWVAQPAFARHALAMGRLCKNELECMQ